VILPGRGPLSGIALERAGDRVHQVEPGIHTAADLDISVSNRIDELIRIDQRREAERRRQAPREAEALLGRSAQRRTHRVLLVGPQIAKERRCIDSLKLRSYEVDTATTQQEALSVFEHSSPELVIADMSLGRSEGIELIPALRAIAGIEQLPVILVDTHKRPARRQAAQRAGAAGYLAHPVNVSGIAARLEKLVGEPKRRRYTRYPQQLSARLTGTGKPCTATMLGRGGMFLNTRDELPTSSLHEIRISLHEIGRSVNVEAEVLYQLNTAGHDHRGAGLRFHAFPDTTEESLLIDYLQELEQPHAHC
jgi:CheY-like chemotaxis protein